MFKLYNIQNVLAVGILLLLQVSHGWTKSVERIVNGEDDLIENVPSLVQIFENEFFTCGGTLLSKNFVLTAAHCVEKRNASQFIVKAGASTLLEEGVTSIVSKIILPPLWNVSYIDMDVAVLKLKKPLEGPLIQPSGICKTGGKQGDGVRAYGWGRTQANLFLNPNRLQSVNLHYVDRPTCRKLWSDRFYVTETMICAAAPGKTTCNGDSGGPLYINGKVCGIVSYGRTGCLAAGYPTIYTDLTNRKVRAFIKKAMKEL